MSGPPAYDFNAQLLNALGPAPATAPAQAAPAPISPFDFNGRLAQQIAPNPFMQQIAGAIGGPSQVEHPELTINNAGLAGGFSVTPPAAPAPAPPPAASPVSAPAAAPQVAAQQPAPAQMEGGFPLKLAGGGGVIPAHEVERRGPTLLRAQNAANLAQEHAIEDIAKRTEQVAGAEQAMYLDQQRQAIARQNAVEQAAVERQQDLEDRQRDFDQTVKQLSSMSLEPDRFWASRNTGQKIADMIGIALGGFLQGARGGSNPGLDIINQAIDRDIDAQKFAYNATKDTAVAKQTAYAQAMQKYMSPEAATAAARAAALDAVQGQLGNMAAQYKGTTAASQAEMMGVDLQRLKEQQAQAIAFILPQQTGRMFYDPRTGITYNENQAREYAKNLEGQQFELGKQELGQEGTIRNTMMGELLKGEAQRANKADETAKYVASQEQAAKIPEREALIAESRRQHLQSPISGAQRAAGYAGLSFQNSPALYKFAFGKDAAEREQAWSSVVAEARHDLAGANVTPEEAKPIMAGLEGARDNESRLAALALKDKAIKAAKTNIRSGVGDSGANYEENRAGIPGSVLGKMPASFTPHGK